MSTVRENIQRLKEKITQKGNDSKSIIVLFDHMNVFLTIFK